MASTAPPQPNNQQQQQQQQYYYAGGYPPPSSPNQQQQQQQRQYYPSQSQDEGQDPRINMDRSTDACRRVGAFILFGVALTAFTFLCLAVKSCDFVSLTIPNEVLKELASNDSSVTLPPALNSSRRELQVQVFPANNITQNITDTTSPAAAATIIPRTASPSAAPTTIEDTLTTLTFGLFVYQDPIKLYETGDDNL